MKLINYNYGYFSEFECSVHGKIRMSYKEWIDAIRYLYAVESDSFTRDIFIEDTNRRITGKNCFYVAVRVTKTEMLVKRYNLQNYKRGNFILEVTA